jgi:NAD(P)H dehydrogenase (quinone)
VNVLIIHAHPERQSFNGALTAVAVARLGKARHQVEVSDPYAMRFKAAVDSDDFRRREMGRSTASRAPSRDRR